MTQRIPLTHGMCAIVDDETYTLVSARKWHAAKMAGGRGLFYARTNVVLPASGRRTLLDMHRLIIGARPREIIDHRDGDGLNNTLANLRRCTHAQNMSNNRGRAPEAKTSHYRGVHRESAQISKWIASIGGSGPRYLGAFPDEEAAARAYDVAAIARFGEFARTNFPREDYA